LGFESLEEEDASFSSPLPAVRQPSSQQMSHQRGLLQTQPHQLFGRNCTGINKGGSPVASACFASYSEASAVESDEWILAVEMRSRARLTCDLTDLSSYMAAQYQDNVNPSHVHE